jgi:CDP-glucose 4,6-dehydratase
VTVFDPTFWQNRRVLLTGHTGFKGAWLSLWLQSLGAHVHGLSLPTPPSEPSLYELARVSEDMAGSVACDIRDPDAVTRALVSADPEVVIHMAAQPLVRRSLAEPRLTYETNVMGTVNVLEGCRACACVPAIVLVTSDKCYASLESERAYRESDPLGGRDPYSSSKAAAELVASAYRHSFFSGHANADTPRLASARAGNVIGGGDWGEDRLLPDIVRAALHGDTLLLRNPSATRPWQHVLNPLHGYLLLAEALWHERAYARSWNFGPPADDTHTVEWVVRRFAELWPGGLRWQQDGAHHPHEAQQLALDSSQAHSQLGWRAGVDLEHALQSIVEWYRELQAHADMRTSTLAQIQAFRRGV